MDFTLKTYKILLHALKSQGFSFLPFCEYENQNVKRTIILRQDVDLLPENSLEFARIQTGLGIRSTFFFRVVPELFDDGVIREIAGLSHEIGYHYEDVSLAAERQRAEGGGRRAKCKKYEVRSKEYEEIERELVEIAIESFTENLEKLRKIAPVKTVCMHGSPLSRWDSRLLWKYYDYHDFGIVGEPYFDIDFDEVLYLTDTGRRWDGDAVSVRDKAQRGSGSVAQWFSGSVGQTKHNFEDWKVKPVKGSLMNMTDEGIEFQKRYRYRSTTDIIKAIKGGTFPDRVMITMHPQRWTDKPITWVKELVWQNTKNIVKYFLIMGSSD